MADIAHAELLTCPPETPLFEAARLMGERGYGSILVVEAGQPLGIWTEHDALRLDFNDPAACDAPIRTAMSAPLETIAADAEVAEATLRLQQARVRHLAVVDGDGALCGMVSQTDLTLRYGPEHFLRLRAVGETVHRGPLTLDGDLDIQAVAERLSEARTDAAIIEDPNRGRGILTERDLVAFIARHGGAARVGDVASFPLQSVTTEQPLLEARHRLIANGFRHLGVVDGEDRLVGLLTMADIMEVLQRDYTADLEAALRERDARLLDMRQDLLLARQVLDTSANALVVLDQAGTITSVNPAFSRITGHPAEAVLGTSVADLFEAGERLDFLDDLCADPASGGHWRGRRWCRHRDGGRRALAITAHRIDVDSEDGGRRCALSFHDATDEVGVEEERNIAAIAFDIDLPMVLTDSEARILRVNRAFTDLTGYAAEEVVGRTPAVLKSGRHETGFYRDMWQTLQREGYWQGELWNRKRDGTVYPERLTITAVRGTDGAVTHYVGTLEDIIERKRLDEALHALAGEFANLSGSDFYHAASRHLAVALELDHVFVGLLEPDRSGIQVVAGWSGDGPMAPFRYDLNGTPCENVISRGACIYPTEVQRLFPDDELLVTMGIEGYCGVPLLDRDGQPLGLLAGLSRHELRESEAASRLLTLFEDRVAAEVVRQQTLSLLHRREEHFRALFESAAVSVMVHDRDSLAVIDANQRALDAYAVPDVEALRTFDIFSEYSDEEVQERAEALRQGGPQRFEWQSRNARGELFWEEVCLTEVPLGGELRIVSTSIDISERKRFEEELKRSNADLEQFAYAVSHDMRQPLRMINSYLQLLERKAGDALDDGLRDYIGHAVDGARRMDAMILALLEYSRVGRKTDAKKVQPARAALDEALEFLEPTLREADARIEVGGEWPQWRFSHDELVRLFQNLVGNALKYVADGVQPQVTVESRVAGDVWRVAISDNGIGIDPAQQDRLFKVFSRLHAVDEYQGTGVGLALCRRIVENHNGTIGVESDGDGRGSRFWFMLPANTGDSAAAESPDQ